MSETNTENKTNHPYAATETEVVDEPVTAEQPADEQTLNAPVANEEHSVPRSGPTHAYSPDYQSLAANGNEAADITEDGTNDQNAESAYQFDFDSQNEYIENLDQYSPLAGEAAVIEAARESTPEHEAPTASSIDDTETNARYDYYRENSPYGDIYTPESPDDAAGETYGEPYADSETKSAAMVRSAAIEPDLETVPELAPMAGGDWDGGPPNGHYNTDLEPWQPAPDPSAPLNDAEMDLFEHLGELRIRLLRAISAVALGMVLTWNFGEFISNWFSAPIRQALEMYAPKGSTLITTDATEAFMTFFQISLVSALLIVAPYVLYEMWAFIEPALTNKERRYTTVLLPFSVTLFFTGCALGYYISPIFFKFFLSFQPKESLANLTYQSTVLLLAKMLLVFGVCFQVPVITIFVNKVGLVSRNWLIEYWRHVVIVIFVVVAILTPTWDPLTLSVCALPPCALYALSIWVIKWL